MKELCNIKWFVQHLIDENEYQYDDNKSMNPLNESNWTYQTNKTFMKYVNFSLKEMIKAESYHSSSQSKT